MAIFCPFVDYISGIWPHNAMQLNLISEGIVGWITNNIDGIGTNSITTLGNVSQLKGNELIKINCIYKSCIFEFIEQLKNFLRSCLHSFLFRNFCFILEAEHILHFEKSVNIAN